VTKTGVYLSQALAPFAPFLTRSDVTDIYVNRPQELWLETLGGTIERHDAPNLEAKLLDRLASQVASFSHQGINREHPLLSATLPGGERVQFAIPPATRGALAVAIRKHQSADLTLDDYGTSGALDTLGDKAENPNAELARLHSKGDYSELLRRAVRMRRNILVSGGTSTGKTTFLNALIREIDPEERLILIEDTPELVMRHANAVGLIAARSVLGEAVVSMEDLLNSSLRMRPDRIILGELRGHEAFTFLRAVNTGHPGSMTTVHADSPERAIEQIALLVLQAGTQLSRENVVHYVRSSIDVFVQLTRRGGRRSVAEIKVRE
jgi:type IV secretion system protein VirB11